MNSVVRVNTSTTPSDWDAAYRYILESGTSPCTRRAHRRDVAYFWSWAAARGQGEMRYPVSKDLLMLFLVDHQGYMPSGVDQLLRQAGKRRGGEILSIRSIRRMVGSLSVAHDERGVDNPCRDAQVRLLLKKAHCTQEMLSHKKQAITPDILAAMLATCNDGLRGIRDRALLLVGFATGGRRRSELAELQIGDLIPVEEGYLLCVRRSKTDRIRQGMDVPLIGEGCAAVNAWLEATGISTGSLFRGIHRSGHLLSSITGETVCSIVKRRIRLIGLDDQGYGAHSLRAGFLTTAARHGVILQDAMALSGHRSERVAQGYYRTGVIFENPAAHLLDINVTGPRTEG